ncbi:hypothetical protein Tco_0988849 [Tanacetum coccineum]|uniref:Uncharacterized protein n=1 Tax=Tanacetum coccineum TaxID=301880 RepID=A0ABQ5ES60_9ASTR
MDQKLKKKAEREEMYEKMRKFMQDMSVGPGGPSFFPTQGNNSFFEGAQATPSYGHNMATPNWQTPMLSHPSTSNWQNSAIGSGYSIGKTLIPSHTHDEDRVRQLAIMNLGHQFDNACTAKDELRKAYEEYRDIPIEQRALIENFLKIESELDYAMENALFRKATSSLSILHDL